jgi:hypothetical protein
MTTNTFQPGDYAMLGGKQLVMIVKVYRGMAGVVSLTLAGNEVPKSRRMVGMACLRQPGQDEKFKAQAKRVNGDNTICPAHWKAWKRGEL